MRVALCIDIIDAGNQLVPWLIAAHIDGDVGFSGHL
jgi:hypothetical protein